MKSTCKKEKCPFFREYGEECPFLVETWWHSDKGEKELVEFSRKSKLHVDTTAISLKKEHLYYLIGKEYAKENAPAQPTAKLTKLLNELKKADREQRVLKRKIKTVKK